MKVSLFPKILAAFWMSFKKMNVHVLSFSLSWWLTSVQYTNSTETAVVAFLFSVSRTQFFGSLGVFFFQTICLKLQCCNVSVLKQISGNGYWFDIPKLVKIKVFSSLSAGSSLQQLIENMLFICKDYMG